MLTRNARPLLFRLANQLVVGSSAVTPATWVTSPRWLGTPLAPTDEDVWARRRRAVPGEKCTGPLRDARPIEHVLLSQRGECASSSGARRSENCGVTRSSRLVSRASLARSRCPQSPQRRRPSVLPQPMASSSTALSLREARHRGQTNDVKPGSMSGLEAPLRLYE